MIYDDRTCIVDPPDYATRLESDDTPEQLGDDFEITAEERQRLTVAAQFGPNAVRRALAGDPTGLDDMRKLHVTRYQVMR